MYMLLPCFIVLMSKLMSQFAQHKFYHKHRTNKIFSYLEGKTFRKWKPILCNKSLCTRIRKSPLPSLCSIDGTEKAIVVGKCQLHVSYLSSRYRFQNLTWLISLWRCPAGSWHNKVCEWLCACLLCHLGKSRSKV